MNKKSPLSAFLTAILIAGLVLAVALLFGIVHAKPSVPEFNMKLEAHPYDVPPTYGINPYTGENMTTQHGYHVENKKIGMKIKNQPFTSYYDDSLGQTVGFYYNIRFKGSFSEEWRELYNPEGYPHQWSDSDYTVITFLSETGKIIEAIGFSRRFPDGAQVDYQVEAMIGYCHRDASKAFAPWVFTGERSGWSETQAVTISAPLSPILSEALIIIVVAASLGLVIYLIKRKQ